jgi:hypothetical protein
MPDFDLDNSLKQVAGFVRGRVSLPPPEEIRRRGQRRGQRRTAFVSGTTVAVIALVAGVAVGKGGDDRREPPVTNTPTVTTTPTESTEPTPTPSPSDSPTPTPEAAIVTAKDLLTEQEFARGDGWQIVGTDDGTNGPYHPCQRLRTAGSDPEATLARRFRGELADQTGLQLVEADRTVAGAERAFATMKDWYLDCRGVELEYFAWTVDGVGDEAVIAEVAHPSPGTTETFLHSLIMLARTGRVTTAVIMRQDQPEGLYGYPSGTDAALVTAVRKLCDMSGGSCADSPDPTRIRPDQSPAAGWLAASDLPPVPGLAKWQTGPVHDPALNAGNGTVCEEQTLADAKPGGGTRERMFDGGRAAGDEPTATEIVGRFATDAAAQSYLARFATAFDSCADKTSNSGGNTWVMDLRFDPADGSAGRFLHLGIAREGKVVVIVQLSYDARQAEDAGPFGALLDTAAMRLSQMEW